MATASKMLYPREDEITLTLRVRTTTEEDREYFLLENNEVQPGFLADCFDMLDMISGHIISINGKNQREYHKILQGSL